MYCQEVQVFEEGSSFFSRCPWKPWFQAEPSGNVKSWKSFEVTQVTHFILLTEGYFDVRAIINSRLWLWRNQEFGDWNLGDLAVSFLFVNFDNMVLQAL